MKVLAVIPARYASTRFPGKPLAQLGGESIVSRVWRTVAAMGCVSRTVVATDDERIGQHIDRYAGRTVAMLTAASHRSGTDRCGEVLRRLEAQGEHYDVVVNVQGDEPFVGPDQVEALLGCFADAATDIATLCTRINDLAELHSANNVKVVRTAAGRALYFSRQPIPYRRGVEPDSWLDGQTEYYKHVGIYAFRSATLKAVCALAPSMLETSESLEQLRWLEAGMSIAVATTPHANIGIDTPADLAAAEQWLQQHAATRAAAAEAGRGIGLAPCSPDGEYQHSKKASDI